MKLYGGALASLSDRAVFTGANAAAVQHSDGAWEVIQFANAELVADNTYELSKLLRGQAGSEWAMEAVLSAGSPFVVLDQHVLSIVKGADALERSLQLRIVMAGRDHGDATALALAATPRVTALKPLAPLHLKAVRGGSGVTFSWIRRTRIDGDTWVGEVRSLKIASNTRSKLFGHGNRAHSHLDDAIRALRYAKRTFRFWRGSVELSRASGTALCVGRPRIFHRNSSLSLGQHDKHITSCAAGHRSRAGAKTCHPQ